MSVIADHALPWYYLCVPKSAAFSHILGKLCHGERGRNIFDHGLLWCYLSLPWSTVYSHIRDKLCHVFIFRPCQDTSGLFPFLLNAQFSIKLYKDVVFFNCTNFEIESKGRKCPKAKATMHSLISSGEESRMSRVKQSLHRTGRIAAQRDSLT